MLAKKTTSNTNTGDIRGKKKRSGFDIYAAADRIVDFYFLDSNYGKGDLLKSIPYIAKFAVSNKFTAFDCAIAFERIFVKLNTGTISETPFYQIMPKKLTDVPLRSLQSWVIYLADAKKTLDEKL
jgi:hypothetical protein